MVGFNGLQLNEFRKHAGNVVIGFGPGDRWFESTRPDRLQLLSAELNIMGTYLGGRELAVPIGAARKTLRSRGRDRFPACERS